MCLVAGMAGCSSETPKNASINQGPANPESPAQTEKPVADPTEDPIETPAATGHAVASQGTGPQQNPDVARAGSGAAVIVWAGKGDDPDLLEVMARRYDSRGEPVGPPFRVNQAAHLRQYKPRVAMAADGSFVVVWLSEADGLEVQIYARRYAADGTPLGAAFRVSAPNRSVNTTALDIGMNATGQAVIVWSRRQSLGGLAKLDMRTIVARRLSPDGELSEEFRAAANPLPHLRSPAVDVAPNGSFAIVWHSDSSTNLTTGIFARFYRANGRPFGPLPRRISPLRTDVAAVDTPRIAYGPKSNFVIAWTGYAANTKPVSVFLRRYGPNRRALGPAQQIGEGLSQPSIAIDANNQLTLVAVKNGRNIVLRRLSGSGEVMARTVVEGSRPYHLLAPAVDVNANNHGLIAWQDFGRDGHGPGVFESANINTGTSELVGSSTGNSSASLP